MDVSNSQEYYNPINTNKDVEDAKRENIKA